MAIFSRFFQTESVGRLGRKLLLWILLGSAFFTMLGTMAQLTIDYRKDMEVLVLQLEQIRTSRLASLTSSLCSRTLLHLKS